MKKLSNLFVLIVILVTVFTSCTKDISGPVDVNFAEGKWNFDKSTVSSSGFTLPYTTDYLKNEDGCPKDYIELLTGGVAKNGNYTSGCAFEQKVGIWSTSGTNLIMSVAGSGIDGTFAIVSLSATELILKIDGTYEGKSGTLNLYFKK
ncbi:lipocalin family protein [Flavobacterium sp.]|uniref:lipocalin family protein n=1 Tax=Flavobacterium sp. TaxID=239 RepID=UPI00286DAB53|nr:lipocalin family protein [Flavobacterium sp.]